MSVTYSGTVPAPWIAQAVYQFNPLNQRFRAADVARPIVVMEKSGTMASVNRAGTMGKGLDLQRAPGASYARGGVTASGAAYECLIYGYEHKIPREQEALFRSIMQSQVVAGQTVLGELYTGREARIASLLCNTSLWTGSALFADNHAAPWDTAASDVIGQVGAAAEKVRANTGLAANALITSRKQIVNLITKNTAILAKFSGVAVATPDMVLNWLAAILGLEMVIPFEAVYDAGNPGDSTPTITDVWNEDYAMVARVARTDDPSEPCVARLLTWEAMGAGTAAEFNVYTEPQTNSTVVQGNLYEDELVVDKYCGFLMEIDPTS
jgi:hypothetical protein